MRKKKRTKIVGKTNEKRNPPPENPTPVL